MQPQKRQHPHRPNTRSQEGLQKKNHTKTKERGQNLDPYKSIVCGECGSGFHPERLCLGVDQDVIDVLLRDNQGAVRYICCGCRSGSSVDSSVGGEQSAFKQLLSIVGGLVGEVKELTGRIGSMSGNATGPRDQNEVITGGNGATNGHTGSSVMEEVRELYEREKRKTSIILRGVGEVTVEEAEGIFADICNYLEVGRVALTDVVRVAPSVFRGKIGDDQRRYALLAEAPRLRTSQSYRNVYVQRDLTYRQRMDVIARRTSRRDDDIENARPTEDDENPSGVVGRGRGINSRGFQTRRGRGGRLPQNYERDSQTSGHGRGNSGRPPRGGNHYRGDLNTQRGVAGRGDTLGSQVSSGASSSSYRGGTGRRGNIASVPHIHRNNANLQ